MYASSVLIYCEKGFTFALDNISSTIQSSVSWLLYGLNCKNRILKGSSDWFNYRRIQRRMILIELECNQFVYETHWNVLINSKCTATRMRRTDKVLLWYRCTKSVFNQFTQARKAFRFERHFQKILFLENARKNKACMSFCNIYK